MKRKTPNIERPAVVFPEGCDRMQLPVHAPSEQEQVSNRIVGERLHKNARELLEPEIAAMRLGELLVAFDEHEPRLGIGSEEERQRYLRGIGEYVTELVERSELGEVA